MARKKAVPASLVGQIVRCPFAASLDRKGVEISAEHHERRNSGNTYHDLVNHACEESTGRTAPFLVGIALVAIVIAMVVLWWI